MAHIMLPSSELCKQDSPNLAKYADTAIPTLINDLKRLGACTLTLKAKMAGGAKCFPFLLVMK